MEEKEIKEFIEKLDKYYKKVEEDENYYPLSSIKATLKVFVIKQ